mmetsp:Transcript_3243/g.10055  ORF Transcript_3243/g.10055 Transcript_3243/m.10055 type:complete len:304 (-) Transcript_3243:21-932(-)
MDMASACWRRASSSSTSGTAGSSGAGSAGGSSAAADCSVGRSASRCAAAAACWRARSSSIETRRAMASSGSRFASTPPKLAAPASGASAAAVEPWPPSGWTTGEEMRTSEGTTPGGIWTKFELSCEVAASTNCRSLSAEASSDPRRTTSTAMLFFFSSFPALTRAFASASTGDPTNSTSRCPPFLLRRCFSASCATWTPSTKLSLPAIDASWSDARILPMSSVGDTRTRAPPRRPTLAIVRTPTEFSAFCCIFAPTTKFAASCCDSCRVGTKSPFRMCSDVSKHTIVHSNGIFLAATTTQRTR